MKANDMYDPLQCNVMLKELNFTLRAELETNLFVLEAEGQEIRFSTFDGVYGFVRGFLHRKMSEQQRSAKKKTSKCGGNCTCKTTKKTKTKGEKTK